MAYQLPAPIDNSGFMAEILRKRLEALQQPTPWQTLGPAITQATGNITQGVTQGLDRRAELAKEAALAESRGRIGDYLSQTPAQRSSTPGNEAIVNKDFLSLNMKPPALEEMEAKRKQDTLIAALQAKKGNQPVETQEAKNKRLKAESQAKAEGAYAGARRANDDENKLANDFQKTTKEFPLVATAYNRIIASSKTHTPASDMSMIFNFMKMLDPGSTVREGEYATARDLTRPAAAFLMPMYNMLVDGTQLTDKQRNDFLTQAKTQYGVQLKQHKNLETQFKNKAKRQGLNPDNVVIKLELQDESSGGGTDASGLSDEQLMDFLK